MSNSVILVEHSNWVAEWKDVYHCTLIFSLNKSDNKILLQWFTCMFNWTFIWFLHWNFENIQRFKHKKREGNNGYFLSKNDKKIHSKDDSFNSQTKLC